MRSNRRAWSFEVGSIASIPVRIHATLLALLIWLVIGSESPETARNALFGFALFTCVLGHELAHAFVAKRYGVETRDITLYPFGGVATLLAQPKPKAELLIAVVGPLFNALTALTLYPFIDPALLVGAGGSTALPFKEALFMTNVGLALFNLLPALPMDGGRVLRATLNLVKVKHATAIAARISQVLCLVLAVTGAVMEQPLLFLIAFFVFFGAIQEFVRAESRVIAVAFTAGDAMIPRERLEKFTHGTTVSQALKVALTSLQPLFPVMMGENLVGVVFRDDILHHAAAEPEAYVSAIMVRSLPSVDADTPLTAAFTVFEETGSSVIMVTRGEFAGLLVQDRLAEFILMSGIHRDKNHNDDDAEWSVPL